MAQINVKKRNGSKELLNIEKLHQVVFGACEGLSGVSASEVELKSHIQFYDGITSSEIQDLLIRSAAELITVDNPNYQYVAGRLVAYNLRKQVYGQYEPWHIKKLVEKNTTNGFYDKDLLGYYSDEEWNEINSFLRHSRDTEFSYAGIEQLRGKYLVQNRVSKEVYETPQIAYMLIAAVLFAKYPKETRLKWVHDYYDAISKHDISLPTPVMAGVRTPQRQFSSCVLVETDDSLDSINATTSAVVKYVSQKAGIGLGAGRIRSLGSPVRKGDAYHTGITPFLKLFQSAVGSCNQGGVRKGAATIFYPLWTLEIEDLLVLKNNKGTEDNRARNLDYTVQFNKVMYERLISNENITLFNPQDVPEMYESFFIDVDKFRNLYEAAEKNTKLRKKTISAVELFSKFMTERKETGRIYLMNVDHANDHGAYIKEKAPIRMSNLCQEILETTTPMGTIEKREYIVTDGNIVSYLQESRENDIDVCYKGETSEGIVFEETEDLSRIATCTLSAINWGNIKKPSDFAKPCELAVRALDALLDYQSYPVKAAEKSVREFRHLGIGIVNFAYWLAKRDLTYTDSSCLHIVDEYMEAMSYYCIKASADLAAEFGACDRNEDTKLGNGILPLDTYKKDVDEIVSRTPTMPWDDLRIQLKKTGIRHATHLAVMPSESSSQIMNATNGIEPPRSLISIKQSKDGVLKQVVPEIKRLKNKYELLWDQKSPIGYLNICAVITKWINQAVSTNTSYNPKFYPDGKIPMSVLLKDLLFCYKFGLPTLYYLNTNDGQGEIDVEKMIQQDLPQGQTSGQDEICESCAI